MDIRIRKLTADDVALYRELRFRSVREHPDAYLASEEEERARSEDDDRARLAAKESRDDDFVLAALDGDRPVGLIGGLRLSPHRAKGRHRALIWGVYVAPGARRRGVGRRLMEEALARLARAPGIEVVQLGVGVSNPAARALYEAMGFRTYGVEQRAMIVDGRPVDEELMALVFDKPDRLP